MRYTFIFLLLAIVSILSCGIESMQEELRLKPPLGIDASVLSNSIVVSFWSYNDEYFFDGFKIFIAYTDPLETLTTAFTGYEITNKEGIPNKPTLYNLTPSSNITRYYFSMDKDINNMPFTISNRYFFYAKAFSTVRTMSSPSSDVAVVMYYSDIR